MKRGLSAIGRAGWWVGLWVGLWLGLCASGCAVDSGLVVCTPGRAPRDGICQDVVDEPEVSCVAELAEVSGGDGVGGAGAPCARWQDCDEQTVCGAPGPEELRHCEGRCELQAGGCASGLVCSLAGLCLNVGEAGLGEVCDGGVCAAGLGCASEDARCHEVCDPRAAVGCPSEQVCVVRASGLGLCMPRCA